MALLFLDSFDHYATAEISQKYSNIIGTGGGSQSISASNGRRSTQCYRNDAGSVVNDRYIERVLTPSGATAIIGVAFRAAAMGGQAQPLLHIMDGSTVQVSWRLNANRTISVYRGNGSTLLGTTTEAIALDTYYYIEFKVTIDNTTGSWELRINGVTAASGSSVDTQNSGAAQWNGFRLGHISGGTSTVRTDWDDLYVADGSGSSWNNFVGDIRLDAVYPNAAGNSSQFTRSTGADQWATIDEALANGDTDHNESTAVTNKDTLNFPNAPVAGAAIKGLQIVVQAKKTDAGALGMKFVTRLGGTDYLSAEQTPTTGYLFHREPQSVKPSDSTAWTDTDFNGAEFGYQRST